MEKILETATALGSLIKECKEYKALDAAKAEYEACHELSEYIKEYETDQVAIQEAAEASEADTHLIDSLQGRIDELFKLITEHPAYIKLCEAQEAVNQVMEKVNNQITFAITGSYPCTHNCSTCHGGCNH